MVRAWKRYLLYFAQEHVDFRKAECDSIISLLSLKWKKIGEDSLKPFWIVDFPNDEAALKFASRSIALRAIFELWSHGSTASAFHQNLEKYTKDNADHVRPYFQKDCSFKITVESYNKHFSHKEKVDKIESLESLPLEGSVNLKTPQVEWWYIEFWGLDQTAVPEVPEDILFGRFLAFGQRHLIKELSLKNRKFIGNTSMDAQLSLLMANQALVREGDLVFDPFVGTGSMLVTAAKFGGYVLGADIDFMMLHARCRPSRITQKVRDKDESVLANLKQYGCSQRYLDVIVSDFSNPLWCDNLKFDSIITDPPYGIREATERVETKVTPRSHLRTEDMQHYPSTSPYALHHLYSDLVNFAAKHLRIGGRLVCWLPFHREDYTDKMVPRHDNLHLISNSEQPLMGLTSRRLLTYEKHSELPLATANNTAADEELPVTEFRDRYFHHGVESRQERRIRMAHQREQGRLEALKRDKEPHDMKAYKCNLNKARHS